MLKMQKTHSMLMTRWQSFLKENRREMLVFLSGFLVTLSSIFVDFYLDDVELLFLAKEYVQNPLTIPTVFVRGNTQAGYYRPVVALFWTMGYSLWGASPEGFQILLAILTGVGVVYLYRIARILKDETSGLIACFVFVLFFPTIALFTWKSASSVWVTSFCLMTVGIFYFLKWVREGSKEVLYIIVSSFTLTGAYLSNEASAVLLPILFCYTLLDWYKNKENVPKLSKLKQVIFLLSLSVIFILVFIISRSILGGMVNPLVVLKPSIVATNVQFYVMDYYLRYLTVFLMIPVLLAVIIWRSIEYVYALIWAGFSLIPALIMNATAYRWGLFTTAGMALLFGFALSNYPSTLKKFRRKKCKHATNVIFTIAVVTLLCSGMTQIVVIDIKEGAEIIKQRASMSNSLSTFLNFLSNNLPTNSAIYFGGVGGMHFVFQLDMTLDIYHREDINVKSFEEITEVLKTEMVESFIISGFNYSQSFAPYWSINEEMFDCYVFKVSDVVSEINFTGLTLLNKQFYDVLPGGSLEIFIAANEIVEIEYLDFSEKDMPNRKLEVYINDFLAGEINISNPSGQWSHSMISVPNPIPEKTIMKLEFVNPNDLQPFAISSVRSKEQS